MLDISPNLQPLLPVSCVVAAALAILVVDLFTPEGDLRLHGTLAAAGLAGAAYLALAAWGSGEPGIVYPLTGEPAAALMVIDAGALFTWCVLVAAAAATLFILHDYSHRRGMARGELLVLILLATAGMMLLASASDLVLLFLALELFSLALYVLAGFRPWSRLSLEAALKYFLLGSVSAAFFLYGVALVYVTTGTTNLVRLGAAIGEAGQAPALVWLGVGLLVAALVFKLGIVPFHQWAPDVYSGAPTPHAGFMAAGTKAAAVLALARILWLGAPALAAYFVPLLAAAAAVTMVVGNLAALVQADLKRMLAFSAIAHAGYILAAVVAGPPLGVTAALVYGLAYGVTTLGAFGVVAALAPADPGHRAAGLAADTPDPSVESTDLSILNGLSRRHLGLALVMAVCMLSLTGLPPTLGFLGKWSIFRAVVAADLTWLAVVIMATSVVSAFTYFRPVLYMFVAEPPAEPLPSVGSPVAIALGVAALVAGLGVALAVPMAEAAEAAGSLGQVPAEAGPDRVGPGLYFTAPELNRDRR